MKLLLLILSLSIFQVNAQESVTEKIIIFELTDFKRLLDEDKILEVKSNNWGELSGEYLNNNNVKIQFKVNHYPTINPFLYDILKKKNIPFDFKNEAVCAESSITIDDIMPIVIILWLITMLVLQIYLVVIVKRIYKTK